MPPPSQPRLRSRSRRRRRQQVTRKVMIWVGGGVAAVILLPLLVLTLAMLTIDPNSYKEQLEASMRQVLGRDLKIRGQLSVTASFSPKLEAEDVTLINMPSGSRADMVRIERVTIEVATRALLTGRMVVSRIALQKPDILLETDAKGNANWAYRPPLPPTDADGPVLALTTVHVRDGRITWRDGATGATELVDMRRLSVTAATPEAPLVVGGEFAYGKQRIMLAAQTGPLGRFLDAASKAPWGVFANFESGGAKLTLAGALTQPREFKGFSVRADLTAVNLASLEWLLPWRLPPLHNFSATARLLDTGQALPDISGVVMQSGFTNLDKIAPGLTIDSLRLEMPRMSEPVTMNVEGSFASAPLRLVGTIGAPSLLLPGAPAGQGFNIDVNAEAAGATLAVRGTIADAASGKGMDVAVGARIPDLSPLSPLFGVRLPQIKGVAFAGQLADGDGGWRVETVLRNIVLAAPQGDIAGSVGLAWGARPRLRASLKSVLFDADAIQAAWDASRPTETTTRRTAAGRPVDVLQAPPLPRRGEFMISDERLPFEALRTIDVDFRGSVDLLRYNRLPYRDVSATLVLADGRMVVNPLTLDLAGGRGELRLAVTPRPDAQGGGATVALSARMDGVDARPVLAGWGLSGLLVGKFDGEAELQSAGSSWHELAAGASGRVSAALADGEMDTRLATGLVLDVFRNIRSSADRLEGGRSKLRCASLAAEVAKGQMTLTRLGVDTARLLLTAGGQVDLARETMAVQLRTALRNGSNVTPVPLRVDAGWAEPRVTADGEARGAGPGEACAPAPRKG